MENETVVEEVEIRVRHDINPKVPGYNNFTLAITLPDPDSFLRAAADFVMSKRPALLLGVGLSRVHPEDKPNRKRGRNAAIAAMKSEAVKIEGVFTKGTNPPDIIIVLTPVRDVCVTMTCSRGRVSLTDMYCPKNLHIELKNDYLSASAELADSEETDDSDLF
jgi:hypothetical protein